MRKAIRINILKEFDGTLYIAGRLFNFNPRRESITIADENGFAIELQPVKAPALDTIADDGKKPREGFFYEVSLPLRPGAVYRFICTDNGASTSLSLKYGKYSKITGIEGSYFTVNDVAIIGYDDAVKVVKANLFTCLKLSRNRDRALAKTAPSDIIKMRNEVCSLRKSNKPIWLVSDRSDSAGDNGEAFFEYLMKDPDCTHAKDKYDIRFVISSSSPDYERMVKLGPVIDAGSHMHKVFHAASSMVISSAADEWIRNPLGANNKYFRDILNNRYVFLQHGIIKDDLSGWLHKAKKDLDIFITSTASEWQSICEGNYGYSSREVKLTGLARYDKLKNSPEKIIAILPTWRRYAAADIIEGSSERPYSEEFKDTAYFKFYDSLINDSRLTGVMKEHGYSGVLYMHPNHMKQCCDFTGNDTICVWQDIVPFSKVFSQSSLLVTDYSSVAIDFAYLGKPVVYTQFDKEKFFRTHSYAEGYYDYERDGFGPVCYDYESAIECLIRIIEKDCIEPDIYRQRVDDFFAFRDTDNCRRIYAEITKLL